MITSAGSQTLTLRPSIPDNAVQLPHTTPDQCERLVESRTGRELTIRRYDTGAVEVVLKRPDIDRLVLSGGGAKGVAYSGMLKALEDHQVLAGIRSLYGSSAGAITAALLASGMGYADFDEMSDTLNLLTLLDSEKKTVRELQHLSSTLGEKIAKIPGKAGNVGKLLADLLPRLGTKATGLETLIREKTVASIRAKYNKALEKGPLCDATKNRVTEIETRGHVTFADLATLSKVIPEIKQLHITGTAMFKGRAQLVVFNDSLTPDMDVARAAHISGSLPVVFQSPTEKGLPFQDERTSFKDGGIMHNTPEPGVFEPVSGGSTIPQSEPLILKFQTAKSGNKNDRGTLLSGLTDKLIGAPHGARDAQETDRIKAFEKYTVIVPLKTDHGDFTGMIDGTVNFSMPIHLKNHLQKELEIEMDMYLASRNQSTETYDFKSVDEALLALDDESFDEAIIALQNDRASQAVIHFRKFAQLALDELKQALQTKDTFQGKLELTPDMRNVLATLDELADTPQRSEWLAKKLNHGNVPDYMELLQAVKRMDAGTTAPKSAVMTKAIEEMGVRDIITKSENFIREVIYPSLYRVGQPDLNVTLLTEVTIDLREARTAEAYNKALTQIVDKYVSRNSPFSSFVNSTTVEEAKDWLIPKS
ncbi:patatin-like phospholipase family protein [Pseudomonas sp. ZT5P21]